MSKALLFVLPSGECIIHSPCECPAGTPEDEHLQWVRFDTLRIHRAAGETWPDQATFVGAIEASELQQTAAFRTLALIDEETGATTFVPSARRWDGSKITIDPEAARKHTIERIKHEHKRLNKREMNGSEIAKTMNDIAKLGHDEMAKLKPEKDKK